MNELKLDTKVALDLYFDTTNNDANAAEKLQGMLLSNSYEIIKTIQRVQDKEESNTWSADGKVRVCAECGTPLIWTFAFAYNERYCLNCNAATPMFDGNPDIPNDKEVFFLKRIVNAVWDVLYSREGMMSNGHFQRSDCDMCRKSTGERVSHWDHATEDEKEWHAIAKLYLPMFKGLFTNFVERLKAVA
jgi:hypothetical protein